MTRVSKYSFLTLNQKKDHDFKFHFGMFGRKGGLGGNIVGHVAFLQSVCGWVTRHNGALYGAIFSGFLNPKTGKRRFHDLSWAVPL